jgi:hypothetical protein
MDGKFVVRGNGDALSSEAMDLRANHRRVHHGLAETVVPRRAPTVEDRARHLQAQRERSSKGRP